MALTPTLLLVPSVSAGQILLRRLAREKRAIAGISAMRPKDLAQKMAEALAHASGLMAWESGHGALLSAKLLAAHPELLKPGLPEAPVARVLARTLDDLRASGIKPLAVRRLAERSGSLEDRSRLLAVASIYGRYHAEIDARFFDETRLYSEAETAEALFLAATTVLFSPDLEPRADEFRFLKSLAVRFGAHRIADRDSEAPGSFSRLCDEAHIPATTWAETVFAPIIRESRAEISSLTEGLFEAPGFPGVAHRNHSAKPDTPDPSPALAWVTAPGEASEVRSIARLILKAAREGTPFDEMAVAIPQADVYAPILVDIFVRAKIPFKLHPSLPLATGRIARSFLLLLGSRGFDRGALLEFLTFAPVPLADKTGDPDPPHPSVFDQITRELKVVSGLDRFRKALDHFVSEESKVENASVSEGHRSLRSRRVKAARALRAVVESLDASLAFTRKKLPLDQWSNELLSLFGDWIRPTTEIERTEAQLVCETLEEIGALSTVSPAVTFDRVSSVIEAQFERKRRPLEERSRVGVHVGSPEALSGGRFRFLALLGLVEGGYPGIFRPDPFLLDPERQALSDAVFAAPPPKAVAQLSLFDNDPAGSNYPAFVSLPTTKTRVARVRRMFARTLDQAEETLILSYPRADEQTGRERLPSLFMMAALQAAKGVAVTAEDLQKVVTEDEDGHTDTDLAIDLGERDIEVVARHGLQALSWLEQDRPFLRSAHELSRGRAARRLSPFDGLVGREGEDTHPRLDPIKSGQAISASRIAAFGECGFRYFLRYVLRLEPAIEPEERRKLDPLEKGTLFHEVAELFLRERRDQGTLPIRNTDEERARLLALGDERLEAWVEGSPPRLVLLWRAEKKVFLNLLADWLAREAENYRSRKTTPAHFEVSFGMPHRRTGTNEPHRDLPVEIPLDDGSVLKISGQIDRIDRIDAADGGGLVLRDYKTGKAPTDADASLFKGGRQLQIPFYILAAQEIFQGETVVEAFLDYVNAGRQVAFNPAKATSATFRALLLRIADLIGHGVFMQEPSACTFCDFTSVCGPTPILESRKRRRRIHDPLARRVAELKQFT
ncbi:MAG: exodeoxyribonuclease V subunit gamma [Vicinamibacteria bacterium]|nr:exodeoxyribonuclease V subunit gamma [Vicinamibacteria bacterium]